MERYERQKALGNGSFGTAWLVREKQNGRRGQHRVVKEIDLIRMPETAKTEAFAEANVLRSLAHINVIAYFDAFMEESKLFIVMEFADGGDLAAAVRQRKKEACSFNQDEALAIFMQCCLALQHIHARHVLHRDLKCQNIFLTTGRVVKLGDFGIAKVLDCTHAEANTVIGTPSYLPPEVVDNKPYGIKADIWSLGVVLYELLVLEPPFQGNCLAALVVKIVTSEPKPVPSGSYSEEVRSMVTSSLQKRPEMRPSTDELLALPALRHGYGLLPPVVTESLRSGGGNCNQSRVAVHEDFREHSKASSSSTQSRSHRRRPSERSFIVAQAEEGASQCDMTPLSGGHRPQVRDQIRCPMQKSDRSINGTPRRYANSSSPHGDLRGCDAVDELILNRHGGHMPMKSQLTNNSIVTRNSEEASLARFGEAFQSQFSHNSPRYEAPPQSQAIAEYRRNRDAARQFRSRSESESSQQRAHISERSCLEGDNGIGSALARKRERQRNDTDGQHFVACNHAAEQSRHHAKQIQVGLNDLDKGTSIMQGNNLDGIEPVIHSVAIRDRGKATREEQRLKREKELEEARLATRLIQQQMKEKHKQSAASIGEGESFVVARSDSTTSDTPRSLGRFDSAADDRNLPAHNRPRDKLGSAILPLCSNRNGNRTPRSCMGLVGGMVAAVGSSLPPETNAQFSNMNCGNAERSSSAKYQCRGRAEVRQPLTQRASGNSDTSQTRTKSMDVSECEQALADVKWSAFEFNEPHVQESRPEYATQLPVLPSLQARIEPESQDVQCRLSMEDQLIEELSRLCHSPPPVITPACSNSRVLTRSPFDRDCDSKLDFIDDDDDDNDSDSWHIAKVMTEQVGNTLDFSMSLTGAFSALVEPQAAF